MKLYAGFAIWNAFSLTVAITAATVLFLVQLHSQAIHSAQQVQVAHTRTFGALLSDKCAEFRIMDGRLRVGSYLSRKNSREALHEIRKIRGEVKAVAQEQPSTYCGIRRILRVS